MAILSAHQGRTRPPRLGTRAAEVYAWLCDRVCIAKVALEPVLVANTGRSGRSVNQANDLRSHHHRVRARELQLHLAGHVNHVTLKRLFPDFAERFVKIRPSGARCRLRLADRRLNVARTLSGVARYDGVFRPASSSRSSMAALAMPSETIPRAAIPGQRLNLYSDPSYAPPRVCRMGLTTRYGATARTRPS